MKSPLLCLLAFVQGGSFVPPLSAQANVPATAIAITHVTVIDVENGARLRDQTVVIAGTRIRTRGSSTSVAVPAGARVIDATGKFVIPGLWDMHTHGLMPPLVAHSIPLFVANGLTGVRDMWGSPATAAEVRRDVAAGRRVAPRLIVAGNLVDGTPPTWERSIVADSPARGKAIVDSLARAGAPFIKVYSRLSRETFAAIADEARRVRIPFVGHIPSSVRAADASDAGQRSLEHLFGVAEGCSRAESVAMEQNQASTAAGARKDTAGARIAEHRWLVAVVNTFDGARCDSLLQRFRRNDTWVTPTQLVATRYILPERTDTLDPRLRYVPTDMRREWSQAIAGSPRRDSVDRVLVDRYWSIRNRIIKRMVEIGVPLLAGSDEPNPFVTPGFGLHAELRMLVAAGLTPLQALQTATLNPARFFAVTDSLGSVAPGKLADLVLLDADPLADIANTEKLRAVVLGGRYLDRSALDGLLAEAEKAVSSPKR